MNSRPFNNNAFLSKMRHPIKLASCLRHVFRCKKTFLASKQRLKHEASSKGRLKSGSKALLLPFEHAGMMYVNEDGSRTPFDYAKFVRNAFFPDLVIASAFVIEFILIYLLYRFNIVWTLSITLYTSLQSLAMEINPVIVWVIIIKTFIKFKM